MFKKLNLQILLSYLGLVPYVFITLDKYFFFKIKEEISINFLIYYTIIIFVFIGSTNWNLLDRQENYIVIYGFIPSLISVFIIILNLYNITQSLIILLLIVFLKIQLIFDYFLLIKLKSKKNNYFILRIPLTLLIIVILGTFIIL